MENRFLKSSKKSSLAHDLAQIRIEEEVRHVLVSFMKFIQNNRFILAGNYLFVLFLAREPFN